MRLTTGDDPPLTAEGAESAEISSFLFFSASSAVSAVKIVFNNLIV
jgi:hypothetical protein